MSNETSKIDLTEDEVLAVIDEGPGRDGSSDRDRYALAVEVRRHRAAQRADAARIAEVVRDVVIATLSRLPTNIGGENYGPLAGAIATRVAKQLAPACAATTQRADSARIAEVVRASIESLTPVLSAEERQILQQLRNETAIQCTRWTGWPREAVLAAQLALFNRLLCLGAAPTEQAAPGPSR